LNGQATIERSGRADVRASGVRVEELLAGFDRPLPLAQTRARAEELVRSLVQLYGAGLDRILEIVDAEASADADRVFTALCDDPLVSGLLAVHGLHPLTAVERVQRALDGVRPYIESHEGRVEVLGVEGSIVSLRMAGSCDGCPDISEVRAEGTSPAPEDLPVTLRVVSAPAPPTA
jgi:hypothetical protein